jgi:cytochrome c-type biogenesis protein CcmE
MKLAVIGAIFMAAAGALVWMAVVEGRIPVYKLQDLRSPQYRGEVCRVDDGQIKEILRRESPLEFTITSEADAGQPIRVLAKILPPDNFKEGYKVGVKGTFDPKTGLFTAEEVMTKCPTRYKSTEMAGPSGAPPVSQPASREIR